jgi:glycosyltransferase involved in cell wall biosynthesis
MRCLFLAPLKAPDHPVPSGDRTMARLMWRLLQTLGFRPELASRLRSHCADPSLADDRRLEAQARGEIARILDEERVKAQANFVFTYHSHYKAPDLLGPELARGLAIPYILAEASRAPKRDHGQFAHREAIALRAIEAADLLICLTGRDRVMLEPLKPASALLDLKPFLDLEPSHPEVRAPRDGPIRLLTVAMMRAGRKARSYALLAGALDTCARDDLPWHLTIVGSGSERAEVEALFAPLGRRVTLAGEITDPGGLRACYRAADLFVWPGIGEAYGMVYLEAQSHGLFCLALDQGGIAEVIHPGIGGVLVAEATPEAYASALRNLLSDPEALRARGAAAARFVRRERSLDAASRRLREALARIEIADSPANPPA